MIERIDAKRSGSEIHASQMNWHDLRALTSLASAKVRVCYEVRQVPAKLVMAYMVEVLVGGPSVVRFILSTWRLAE